MCSLERQGRRNEWDVIIPFGSPKTECLKATGPLQPQRLTPCGAFTPLTALDVRWKSAFVSVSGLTVTFANLWFVFPLIRLSPTPVYCVKGPTLPTQFKVQNSAHLPLNTPLKARSAFTESLISVWLPVLGRVTVAVTQFLWCKWAGVPGVGVAADLLTTRPRLPVRRLCARARFQLREILQRPLCRASHARGLWAHLFIKT